MNYSAVVSEIAVKQLNDLDNKTRDRIISGIKQLKENHFVRRPQCDIKQLSGFRNPSLYRLRVGDYRIIYSIENKTVKVTEILRSEGAY